jgi:uncharacterized phage-associated protein
MFNAIDIARYFLSFTDEEKEEFFTNLKLQKLLYYAQGLFLGAQGRPLFKENIEAWSHGPVVPEVYHLYKEYGSAALPKYQEDIAAFPFFVKDILDDVYLTYGQYTGLKLREMSHEEIPWIEAFNKGRNCKLDQETMRIFFKREINKINGLTEEDATLVNGSFLDEFRNA